MDAYAAITYRRPLAAGISGPTNVAPFSYETWYAAAYNGTAPYTYTWYRDGQVVSTAPSYSGDTGYGGFQLQLVVTDAAGGTATGYLWVSTEDPMNNCDDPFTPYPELCQAL